MFDHDLDIALRWAEYTYWVVTKHDDADDYKPRIECGYIHTAVDPYI